MTKKEIKEFIDNNYQKIFNTIKQNIDKIYQLIQLLCDEATQIVPKN